MKTYVREVLNKHPRIRLHLAEHSDANGDFPFGEYLGVSLRKHTHEALALGFEFWFVVWAIYVIMMCLHRFLQAAYVRIMAFFMVLMCITFVVMGVVLWSTRRSVEEWCRTHSPRSPSPGSTGAAPASGSTGGRQSRYRSPTPEPRLEAATSGSTAPQQEEKEELSSGAFPMQKVVSFMIKCSLFFLCYGFVRMVTAPWLWHIYFWNVLILTFAFAALMMIFVFFFAPLVPSFHAAMSIPPNVTENDVAVIVKAMKHKLVHLRKSSADLA